MVTASVCPEKPGGPQAAMGLLSGDTLFPVAMAVAVFLLLVDLMHRRQRWAARYPPGPMPVPGLGNLLQLDFQDLLACCQKLRGRFGDVFSLQLVWKPVVILNGLAAVREALVNHSEDTADRPPMPIYEHLGLGPRSQGMVLAHYGPAWRELRRFTVSTLRNFGLGKKSLEQRVTEEAACLCAAFANQDGHPFRPNALLNKATCNVMASLVYGRRFEYDDPHLGRLLELLEEMLKEESGIVPKAKGNPTSTFHNGNLHMVMGDLFTAGMMTTSTTLAWALLLMILHPDVQRQVHQEIDEVIGQGRRPEMGDQARLPFTNAVIHEVQRFGDIAPLGLPHMTLRDTEVQGFLIPKGTMIIANLSSVLKDETVWEKPFRFHPEHFLDTEGHFVKHEAFMPFSAGRRACLGEPLARMELFLFFTCLLQCFSFSVPEGQPQPSDYGPFNVLVIPSPYQLCALHR
ncbi:cytochrome P450 2D16-like isoform X2 [Heterocephalus glaber]|uniref:Cytochrome P450 n=1 Tax=Heterocephalus glaber TaxID=10181 RepID=A0AAX6T3K0_HETGA|nr:cytochrome P450 2D16-like isoform X2 [Heterocephalus glaber]